MVDPLSLLALGAAVGGAAGKFTEKAWESGEKWIRSFFENHQEKAKDQAKRNTLDFLSELSERISQIEKSGVVEGKTIENAQEEPSFSALLQKAIINASQTNDSKKHDLLAKLVSDRLLKDSESTISLASKMACDAIGSANQRQLKLLGIGAFFQDIRQINKLPSDLWHLVLMKNFRHFTDIEFHEYDLRHLEAISCIRYDPTSERNLSVLLVMKNGPFSDDDTLESRFDEEAFLESDIGFHINHLWTEGLSGMFLTSIGSIIGGHVYENLTGVKCGILDWD